MKMRISVLLMVLGLALPVQSCGKKGPPSLAGAETDMRVEDLAAVRGDRELLLTGTVAGPGETVGGCRVYYAHYPFDAQPCEECPIEYRRFHAFGPEVVSGKSFSCKVPLEAGGVYFFRVHLLGKPGGAPGPGSDPIRIVVE